MRLIYLCSPYRGDYETNRKNAIEYCKIAFDLGVVAFAPHLYFAQFYEDTIPERREAGLSMGFHMLEKSDELWVMGKVHSEGMQMEMKYARERQIPIFYVPEPLERNSYPVSADEHGLLTERDCLWESGKKDYEGKLVALSFHRLKPEYRTSRNQIWRATHGPGCRPNYGFSDTVHVYHPIDGDCMAVARSDLLGVVKPDTLTWLQLLYPEFQTARLDPLETEEQAL